MRHFDHKLLSYSNLTNQHRRLGRSYLLALGLIGLLALASLGLLIAQIDSQARYARMIDLRETQRVLTLRAAFFSLLLGPELDSGRRQQYRRTIVTSLDETERLQKLLPENSPRLGSGSDAADRAALELDRQLRWFIATEHTFLARLLTPAAPAGTGPQRREPAYRRAQHLARYVR